MKREAQQKVKRETESEQVPPRKESAFHNKAKRKSSVAIAKENYTRRRTLVAARDSVILDSRPEFPHQVQSSESSKDFVNTERERQSPLQKEIAKIKQIELVYEQSMLTRKIEVSSFA